MKKFLLIFLSVVLILTASFGAGIITAELIKNCFKNKISETEHVGRVAGVETNSEENVKEILAPLSTDEVVEFDENAPLEQIAPPYDESTTFSFAILGDTQYFKVGTNGGFQKAMKNIRQLKPDMIFSLGDQISSCDDKSDCKNKYEDWKSVLGAYFSKTYPTQGNHDRANENSDEIWQKFFNLPANGPSGYSELAYSFNYKNSHFVVLDSVNPKAHEINGEQRAWLEQDLARNKKGNVFVFYHEPAYPIGTKVSECLDKYPAERNALWSILSRHKVIAVFNGHEHIQSRQKINGVYQLGFGNTDSFDHQISPRNKAEFAYQGQAFGLVEVKGGEITVNIYTVDGKLLDTKTL